MKFLRVTDNKAYHMMSDFEKLAFKQGLPRRYMGHKLKHLSFIDYSIGAENAKHVSAPKQKQWAQDFVSNISRHDNLSMLVGLFSNPTDTAAFQCGGVLFEAAMSRGLSCLCLSMERIAQDITNIPKSDLYLIYGLVDTPVPLLDRAVKSFLYERDGSMRLVVMSGSASSHTPWSIMHEQLRIKPNIMLILNDVDDHNHGNIEFIG